MGVFDYLTEIIQNLFGVNGTGWVKRKNISSLNLENCNGQAISDDLTKTCSLCVALNDTIFCNNNKPTYYHSHCKCKNISTTYNKIILDFPKEKITKYLFIDINKNLMMRSMGYTAEDWEEVYNLISNEVSKEFIERHYILKDLNINGQHIEINFIINGKNNHYGTKFNCHTGCVVWPHGKIKIATPLIKQKGESI